MPAYDKDGFAPAAPVAMVNLRHPDSGQTIANIRMLLDSGADAALVPKSAVVALGLTGTGERYSARKRYKIVTTRTFGKDGWRCQPK